MAINPDKNAVEQGLIARLIGKIKRIALDMGDSVTAETSRAQAAEAAAKTEVVQGENCTIEKTTAADGHDVYTINADGKPQIPADWEQQDSGKPDYINNKPNLALKEDVANKSQSIDPTSTTEYGSSKAVADFVNSSVATNTANFLGTISESSLGLDYTATNEQIALALNVHSWVSTPTNNDYCFVSVNDPQTTDVDEYRRFKFNGSVWAYEYTLNNSSFTQSQWNAINSGIDSSDVAAYNEAVTLLNAHVGDSSIHVTSSEKNAWNAKQDAISDLATIRSGADAGASALQPSGNGSNLSVTPDGTSTGYDLGSSTTLKVFAQKFKNLVGALKALAFKDKASYNDLSSGVQSSLDNADSALQSHQSVTDNNPTLAWGTTSKVGKVGSTDLRVTMPSNPAYDSQRKYLSIYANSTKVVKLFRVYKFTAGSSIGTTVELIGRAGGTAVRVVINIKASITADYIQFYDYAGDSSHNFTLYVAQDPDNSSKNLVYASLSVYGALYLNASDTSAGDTDIDFSVFGDVMSGRISGDTAITLRNMQDASWINSGTFGTDRIADDAITAAKVKDNETLPVNVSGSAGKLVGQAASRYVQYLRNSTHDSGPLPDIGGMSAAGWQSYVSDYMSDECAKFIYNRNGRESFNLVYRGSADNYWGVLVFGGDDSYIRIARCSNAVVPTWEKVKAGDSDYAAKIGSFASHPRIGSTTIPVYVDANGQVQPCDPSQMGVGAASYAEKAKEGCKGSNTAELYVAGYFNSSPYYHVRGLKNGCVNHVDFSNIANVSCAITFEAPTLATGEEYDYVISLEGYNNNTGVSTSATVENCKQILRYDYINNIWVGEPLFMNATDWRQVCIVRGNTCEWKRVALA